MVLILLLYLFIQGFQMALSEPRERWIIELQPAGKKCLDHWWSDLSLDRNNYIKKELPFDNWMVIEVPHRLSASLKDLPCVVKAYPDQKLQWRNTEPNDPAFINQADMRMIGMPQAWDIARGGVTAYGDTIVIAIIDNGFQVDHIDLWANIWRNKDEIPDDNIDNDNNGYTDDYVGLDIPTGTDIHPPGNHHGTNVSGIAGAHGNNGTGISGVNWNVKMMIISGADFESELIESYEYVLAMRKRYKFSNGAEGAFVVATNLSGGIDNAFAVDHPLWCMMYNEMGSEGILSVTAAPNRGISVDNDGDMPTTCTSPYMLAVTNVDLTDQLVGNAGFGINSIDLGAPGHGSITTHGGNQYKEFSGTSAATPHVTGTIALMYSTPCIEFLENLDADPDGVALMIKDIILNTGTPNNSLEGLTLTGKRLQVDDAMRETLGKCETEPDGVNLISINPNPPREDFVQLHFNVTGDTSQALVELYAANGAYLKTYNIGSIEYEQGFITIETDWLPAGIYFISLRSGDKKSTKRFFVW